MPVLLLASCYSIPYSDQTRCSAEGECPSGRTCSGGFCLLMPAPPDAVPAPDAPPPRTLTLSKDPQGNGKGTVRAMPDGPSCDAGCSTISATVGSGALRLDATPAAGSMFLGWTGACRGIHRTCDLPAGAEDVQVTARFGTVTRNLVFVSSEEVPGNFGGVAAADAMCERLATAAGLTGFSWRALLRTRATPARDRLVLMGTTTPARGFLRMDGLPVADEVARLFQDGQVFYPVLFDENGVEADPRGEGGRLDKGFVWTGDGPSAGPAINCLDWSSADAAVSGTGGAARGGPGELWGSYGQRCAEPAPVYCFMTSFAAAVAPQPPDGARRMFVTRGTLTPPQGAATAQTLCDAEKPAGGRAVRALLPTTTEAASPLLAPGATYVRVDGSTIGTTEEILAVARARDFGASLRSGIWQSGDGAYVGLFSGAGGERAWVWTGAADLDGAATTASSCDGWRSAAGSGMVGSIETSFLFWRTGELACSMPARVYCVEVQP